jgi:poly(A) polymerase
MRDGLAMLSKERIHQELTRLLTARAALAAIVSMRDHGILAEVLPAAPRLGLLARIVAIERGRGLEPDAMLRLAALAVETPEDAARIGAAFRLSRAERGVLDLSPRAHAHLSVPLPPRAARALLYREGPDRYRRLVALSWARALNTTITSNEWSTALALPDSWSAPRFPVAGADILARGIPAGPAVGDALRALEAWWIERDFEPDRDALLRRLPSR